MYQIDTKIQYIRGVGPTKAKSLKRLGIHTALDLLDYRPLYWIFSELTPIVDVSKEGHVIIKGKIKSLHRLPTRIPITEAVVVDDTGEIKCRWYNCFPRFVVGMVVTLWGKYSKQALQQPKFFTVRPDWDSIVGGFYGKHNQTIRAALREVLANIDLPDLWEGSSRTMVYAMYHFPETEDEQKTAEHYLKFDELCQQALALKWTRDRQTRQRGVVIEFKADAIAKLHNTPTNEQHKAMVEIENDLASGHTMNRLLHGEVGSGKTLVAFYAAILTALNGKRALVLVPTTILAQQHYDTLRRMGWEGVELYPDNTESSIVIGTHAILNNDELLRSTSLIIIDEFHKFGVEQRAQATKYNPHLLLISATPIPRTLASTVFGDLDVSTIRELPIKRGQVITRWVLPDRRESMYEIIEQELGAGHQVYTVFPRINSGNEDAVNAIDGFTNIRQKFGQRSVGLLTGKADSETKIEVLHRFREGKTDILVSTIIAEVGLDNPNATVMVIEGADRFGLSQLHQLRGRVCRSTDTAYCFLVAETANQTSIDRLEVIERCQDGFEIAEHDLRLRGPGDIFGTEQHGLPPLKHASLVTDYDLILKAKEIVETGEISEGVKQMTQMRYDIKLGSTA